MDRMPNELIAHSLKTSSGLFNRYVADLKPAEWQAQPAAGVNTVAWIVGHLVLIEHRRATALAATGLPELPAGFAERYGQTKKPAGEQTGLDTAEMLTGLFHAVRERLTAAVLAAPADKLAEPLANPHPFFADQGEAVLFMGQHSAMHLGQITVIRRLLGYLPVV